MSATVRIIHTKPFAIFLHEIISLINEWDGRIESRLVSEEDIELTFTLICEEAVEAPSEAIKVWPGHTAEFTYFLHVDGDVGSLTPPLVARFERRAG